MKTTPATPDPGLPPPVDKDAVEWERIPLVKDVTLILVVMNALVFLIEPHPNQPLFRHFFQARYSLSLEGLQAGYWWQFVTYQFLHGGWVHVAVNLILLHSLGPILETTLGRRRFVGLYLLSGVAGGLVHIAGAWFSPTTFGTPVVGASAGLAGLLAALGSLYAEQKIRGYLFFFIPFEIKAKGLLLLVGLVSLAGAIFPVGNIAHLAHLGGLLGGLLCINGMDVQPLRLEMEEKPGKPDTGANPVNRD